MTFNLLSYYFDHTFFPVKIEYNKEDWFDMVYKRFGNLQIESKELPREILIFLRKGKSLRLSIITLGYQQGVVSVINGVTRIKSAN